MADELNLNEARKQIKKNKETSSFEFKPQGITKTTITPTNIETQNLGNYANNYYDLIQQKILKNKDKTQKFMDDVIKHRKQVLQHRLLGEIRLKNTTGKWLATLEVHRMLPEHEQTAREVFLDKKITVGTPSTLNALANELHNRLNNDGVTAVNIKENQPQIKEAESVCKTVEVTITYS